MIQKCIICDTQIGLVFIVGCLILQPVSYDIMEFVGSG